MFPVIRLPAFSCLCLYCVILSRLFPYQKRSLGGWSLYPAYNACHTFHW